MWYLNSLLQIKSQLNKNTLTWKCVNSVLQKSEVKQMQLQKTQMTNIRLQIESLEKNNMMLQTVNSSFISPGRKRCQVQVQLCSWP